MTTLAPSFSNQSVHVLRTTLGAAGFTIVDCLALGAFAHIVGAGIILGLKNTGAL
jgi:hypothetical protein